MNKQYWRDYALYVFVGGFKAWLPAAVAILSYFVARIVVYRIHAGTEEALLIGYISGVFALVAVTITRKEIASRAEGNP